jgi:hypothetical protein
MGAPTKNDLYARENATLQATLYVDDAGTPVDVTGWTFKMQCRRPGDAAGSPTVNLSTVTTDVQGLRIVDAAGGEVAIRIDDTTLSGIADSTGKFTMAYDIQGTRPNGTKVVVSEGTVTVYGGVTQ